MYMYIHTYTHSVQSSSLKTELMNSKVNIYIYKTFQLWITSLPDLDEFCAAQSSSISLTWWHFEYKNTHWSHVTLVNDLDLGIQGLQLLKRLTVVHCSFLSDKKENPNK